MRQIQRRKGYTEKGKRIPVRNDEPIRQEFYDPDIRTAKAAKAGKSTT